MNALIIASNKQISAALSGAVKRSGADVIALAYDAVSAKRAVGNRDFGLCVIHAEDFIGQCAELARTCAARGGGVIVIESPQRYEDMARCLEDDGILVLSKPIAHAELFRAVKMVRAVNNRILRLLEEKRDLLKKIDDMRLVNRAKLILMQNMGFTEEQAHRKKKKRAMDQRRTRADVAMEILKTYEV